MNKTMRKGMNVWDTLMWTVIWGFGTAIAVVVADLMAVCVCGRGLESLAHLFGM